MPALTRKKKTPRYTIRDIARMAGVSRSTVSLAINDSEKINAKTKKEVLELIDRVGYRPNQTARNLVRRSSANICAIIPQLQHVIADQYFAESLSGILDTVTSRGYHLVIEVATEAFKSEKRALKLFRQGSVDAFLCIGALTTDTYLQQLVETGCPVVLVNSCLAGVPDVIAANRQAVSRAVRHLNSLGHKRIAHIRGSEYVTTSVHRTEGFIDAIRSLGLEESPDLTAYGYFDQDSGYQATRWLLSRPDPPTAIFTTNDMMAIGALEAVAERGLRVPHDVAIFGGDDILLARYVLPRLSTMRQNMYLIAGVACEALLAQLSGNTFERPPDVDLKLIIRDSCGALMAGAPRDPEFEYDESGRTAISFAPELVTSP